MGELLVFDRAAVREVDRLAVQRFGLPSIVLMENAALHLVAAVLDRMGPKREPDAGVLICCGKGHNGGDGLAAARHLHNAGVPVSLLLSAEAWDHVGDTRIHADAALRMGLPMEVATPGDIRGAFDRAATAIGRPAIIIDALVGTGLETIVEPGAVLAHLVSAINSARGPGGDGVRSGGCQVVSVDVPSGLDCDSGRPLVRQPDGTSTAVRADLTVTFVGWKVGFAAPEAHEFLGEVLIADIGAPRELTLELGWPMHVEGATPPSEG